MNRVKAIVRRSVQSAQIVSTADAKTHAVIEQSSDDLYVTGLCLIAQDRIENLLRRQLLPAVYSAYLDYFPPPYNDSNDIYESYFEIPFGNTLPFFTNILTGFAKGVRTVTPSSMAGIFVGTRLCISQIGLVDEFITVTAVTSTTFTAFFRNTYQNPTLTTTVVASIPSATQTVTPVSMQSIIVGSVLTITNGSISEDVLVIGVNATNFSANFINSYPSGSTITVRPGAVQVMQQPINYIKYYDVDNKLQTLDLVIVNIDPYQEPARIWLDYLHYWPYTYPRPNCIELNWNCGYMSSSVIPQEIILAIKMLVATWYNKREDTDTAKVSCVPHGIMDLIQDYKIEGFGY